MIGTVNSGTAREGCVVGADVAGAAATTIVGDSRQKIAATVDSQGRLDSDKRFPGGIEKLYPAGASVVRTHHRLLRRRQIPKLASKKPTAHAGSGTVAPNAPGLPPPAPSDWLKLLARIVKSVRSTLVS